MTLNVFIDGYSASNLDPLMTAPDATAPLVTIDGPVATVRLNRPAVHNRLEPADVVFLRRTLAELNDNAAVRVLVLTGTGKSFCSGFDLNALGGGTRDPLVDFQALADEVETARPVTIARLNGPVYGGATDLALACDFRIGVDTARMFMPAAKFGLQYYPHGLRRWVTRLGLAASKSLFLTGRTIEAVEMLRIGFLDEVVPAAGLDGAVAHLVGQLGAMAPKVLEGTKRVLNDVARQQFDDAVARTLHKQSLASRDMREALAARAEGRAPVFTGE
ncbi:3-hydroxybutyryl-CoA dehydratase [Piscinibacter gummiphilus]|nr:3-hydroxybutyryl-CoA dehydratase [Piscinibacter gummiphilus]